MGELVGLTLITSLVTWRLTSLLVSERGPFDIFEKLRMRAGIGHHGHRPVEYPNTQIGTFLGCFWCVSMWCSGLIATLLLVARLSWCVYPLLWLAGSTGAIIIEEVMNWQE